MIVRRFFDAKLAQTSYLIGCGRDGVAVVIDPNRDVEQYVRDAEREGVRITHVTETHIHADFVSGARELARRTGATLLLSDEGDASWKYAYAEEDGATLLHAGDSFAVGSVRLEVLHTPGHTPEHVAFLVTDTATADAPIALVSGDFVFVGDVGRPDLLEKAAGVEGTMQAAARTLFASLRALRRFPDWLQVWPGHGAGSACGKGLSAVPHSTLGYERRFNWAFGVDDEAEFVRLVLAGQPEPPRYFAQMKRINREGPRMLGSVPRPQRLPPGALAEVLARGGLVVDLRPSSEFARGHLPGTFGIPFNRSFSTWAGSVLPYDRDICLLVGDGGARAIEEAVRDLALIGLDRVAGYVGDDALHHWVSTGRALATIPQLEPGELATRLEGLEVTVLDVRSQSEWEEGHLPGVPNVPLASLVERLSEIPRGKPVVVHCQGGARSMIAASVLRVHGLDDVINLTGGFAQWHRASLPVEHARSPGTREERPVERRA